MCARGGWFDARNRNGARLCQHVGCRKHVRLEVATRAHFCRRHAPWMRALYARVVHAPVPDDVELAARAMLIAARKGTCARHVEYLRRYAPEFADEALRKEPHAFARALHVLACVSVYSPYEVAVS